MKEDAASATAHEEKLGHAMVRSRLITEVQLKTALDYQRSLGGTLADVIVKLGFVRPPALTKFLSEMPPPGPAPAEAPSTATPRPGPDATLPRVLPADEGPGKQKLQKSGALKPAPRKPDEEELPTQRPHAPLKGSPGGEGGRDFEAVIEALLNLLAHKGVISQREEELIIQAGARSPHV